MNDSAALRENSLNELTVLFEVSTIIYTRTSISEFYFENEINKPPYGSFILIDDGKLDQIGLQSGSNGVIYFTNSTDTTAMKRMALPVYLTEVSLIDRKDFITYYRIKWTAGTIDQLIVKPGNVIKQSNSTDALAKVFQNVPGTTVTPFSGTNRPSDNMNWLTVNKNMWQQLEIISSKSFMSNDYIFWCWDDVNNTFRISSINTEFKNNDVNLAIRSFDALNSTNAALQVSNKNGIVIWKFADYKKYNTLGSSYKKLFPNVAFLGVPTGVIVNGAISSTNFFALLNALNDTKLTDVLNQTGLGSSTAVFGNLQIRKHTLNGHDLYSIADIYRDYKIATYAKSFFCQLYNVVGPQLGSYISIFQTTNSSETGMIIDNRFSDRYFIKRKTIYYKGNYTSKAGVAVNTPTNYITTLELVSDNYADGISNIQGILNKAT